MFSYVPQGRFLLYFQLLSLSAFAQSEAIALDTATLRLVHIYAYVSFNERTFPEMFGPRTTVSYVFNWRDTITLQPELKIDNRPVRSIAAFDIKFNRSDTLVIEYLQTEWKRNFRIIYRVLPNDTLPEFVSLAVERVPWLFKKTEYYEYTFIAPNIKNDLLLSNRERLKKAKVSVIDLSTRKE